MQIFSLSFFFWGGGDGEKASFAHCHYIATSILGVKNDGMLHAIFLSAWQFFLHESDCSDSCSSSGVVLVCVFFLFAQSNTNFESLPLCFSNTACVVNLLQSTFLGCNCCTFVAPTLCMSKISPSEVNENCCQVKVYKIVTLVHMYQNCHLY